MSDHHHDGPTADQELAMSRDALARGDVDHALHHAGCALVHDPMRPDAMEQLNAVLGQVVQRPDPLAAVAMTENTNFVTAANRSYLLAWMQRWVEALDLITDVAEIRPDVPYLLWAEWWLGQPGVAQSIGWDDMARGILVDLAKIASNCPVPTPDDDPRLPNLKAAGRLIDGVRGLFPREAFVWFTGSMVNRRLGNFPLAQAMAEQAYHLEPAWKNAIGVANALRDSKDWDGAIRWWKKALEHDPSDVSALLDMGDMYLERELWDDAIRTYEQALAKQADHPWATASRYYAWFKKTGDVGHKLALLRLTEGSDHNHRAEALAELLDPPVPYVTYLPHPGDASCNGLNAVFEEMWENPAAHHGATLKLRLSHVESPSVVAAFMLQMEMWGPQVAFDYQVDTIQQPDPRVPKAQVPFVLWQWDGTQPRPTYGKPDYMFQRQLHELIGEPFALDVWLPRAQKLARELGPAAIPNLLASMTWPPRPNGGQWRVLPWTQRAQIAIALVLGHIDGGWQGSERQKILFSLMYGPTDWITGAAIVALGTLARVDPHAAEIRRDVEAAFAWMRTQIPAEGFCAWAYPLAATWIALGGHDPGTLAELQAWQKSIVSAVGQSTVHVCELEAKKFDLAEETAKAQAAQAELRAGGGGDPDPTVFPGQPVAKLSDYVKMMKMMQTGNMMGALQAYGLDMMGYASVATAWGQKLAGDPTLNAKFGAAMAR